MTTSRRNLDLRYWIASTFNQAVLQFCEHDTLRYDWPLFLPSPDGSSDAFWSGLDQEIQYFVQNGAFFRARKRNTLRLISDVFILISGAMDADGEPVFDDPRKDWYLSPKYSQTAVNVLKDYGLQSVSVSTLLMLLEIDLRSANSKMHGRHTTNEWHSVVARMFSLWFEENNIPAQQRLRSLPLLPLRNRKWTSTRSGPVYSSATGDINIPDSLDLRVISLSASQNPDRNTLFWHLGVCEATVDQVRASISRSFQSNRLSFDIIKSYLDYLYLTHQPGTHTQEGYAKVEVFSQTRKRIAPSKTDVYLPGTAHAYSPMSLLAAQGTAPGLSVEFLHSENMDHTPTRPISSHPSWERWLCDFVGIRQRLRLLSPNGEALSYTFLYVFKHRPEKFLGLFEHLWLHEKSNLLRNLTLRSKIKDLPAKDLCGVNFPIKLKETWLPFTTLPNYVMRYMEYPEQFPFLKFEESNLTGQFVTRWNFLNEFFSVGKDVNVDFLLEILRCIQRSCPEPSSVRQTQKVFDLYVALYAALAMPDDEPGTRRKIR